MDKPTVIQAPSLPKTHPFSRLSPEQLAYLEEHKTSRLYAEGEWVVHYGDNWPHIFYVESGEITALKESVEGRTLIVANILPGELFWGLAFFNEQMPMWVSLQANQETKISLWRRKDLLPILYENGEFTWGLTCKLVARMERASEMVEELAFHPIAGRLANLLLEHFGGHPEKFVERDLTLDEMAALIGTTREVVCRQLYRFASHELIQINRTEFKIVDADGLLKFAQKFKG